MKNNEEEAVEMAVEERTEFINAVDSLSKMLGEKNQRAGFMIFALDRGENNDAPTGVVLAMNGSQQVLANTLSAALKHTDLDALLTDVMLHRILRG